MPNVKFNVLQSTKIKKVDHSKRINWKKKSVKHVIQGGIYKGIGKIKRSLKKKLKEV